MSGYLSEVARREQRGLSGVVDAALAVPWWAWGVAALGGGYVLFRYFNIDVEAMTALSNGRGRRR